MPAWPSASARPRGSGPRSGTGSRTSTTANSGITTTSPTSSTPRGVGRPARNGDGRAATRWSGWSTPRRNPAASPRKARNGRRSPTDNAREDTRHTAFYEIGGIWHDTLIRLRQEAYLHASNDAYQDFYDAEDYKVRLSATRRFAKRWNGYASLSYERKNYRERIATTVAESDDIYTAFGSLTYTLNDRWSLGYSFTRKKLDSNAPVYEYTDGIHQLTCSAYF